LALLALALPAHAEEEDPLNGSYESSPPAASSEDTPASPGPSQSSVEDEKVPTPREPHRFKLSERPRLRRWLEKLCSEDPVAVENAERVRFARDQAPRVTRPENKQRSLLLLLENYAELTEFRDNCEKERRKSAEACVRKGRLPKPWEKLKQGEHPAWQSLGSREFWSEIRQGRSPAGISPKTDLLNASRREVRAIESALRANFFELREAADLGGKAGSAATARRILEAVRAESNCAD
jgi:hypothetical protein